MQTAGLLVALAAIGGAVVLRSIWSETAWGGAPAAEVAPQPKATRRGRRRLLTATALSAALAADAEADVRPSFLDRTFAFVRLLLVIVFVCALAGGAIFLIATTLARMFGIQSG